MHLLPTLLTSTLLASTILAAPRPINSASFKHISQGHNPKLHRTNPLVRTGHKHSNSTDPSIEADAESSNWAGAVITSPPYGANFNTVSGSFIVPQPSLPPGAQSGETYSAAIWVGIDGDTYGNAILQTGITIEVDTYGDISYGVWYEWYPNPMTFWSSSDISINPGDWVTVSVAADSPSSGEAMVCDDTTGVCVSQYLTAPSSSSTLAGQNAEWIVEDFSVNGEYVPFCDFGQVEFVGAAAGATDGSSQGVENAEWMDIVQNGETLANCWDNDGGSFYCQYA